MKLVPIVLLAGNPLLPKPVQQSEGEDFSVSLARYKPPVDVRKIILLPCNDAAKNSLRLELAVRTATPKWILPPCIQNLQVSSPSIRSKFPSVCLDGTNIPEHHFKWLGNKGLPHRLLLSVGFGGAAWTDGSEEN